MIKRKIFSFAFLLGIICAGYYYLYVNTGSADYNNTVTMLDVGQASCTLIESDGQFCLIDAGKAGGNTDIVSYLHHRGVKKIDVFVLTHFHYDHTSEALDIIRNFDIGTIVIPDLEPEYQPDTYFYKSLREDAKSGYYTLEYAQKGNEYAVGRGTLKILTDTYNSDNINNTSTVTCFTLNDFIYVNTGDTEADREQYIIDDMPENITLFTAGHHGSQDSNSQRFIEKLKPQIVGISCGADNDYGHPHKNVLDRFDDMNIQYFITYETGNIVYSADTQQFIKE